MRLPIVVVGSAPRCGSTAFCNILQKKLSIPCFLEPWGGKIFSPNIVSNPSPSDLAEQQNLLEYLDYRKTKNNYILKFFIQDIEYRSPYHHELSNGYKIGIMRKNAIDQIASWYIADARNKFGTFENEVEEDYSVEINEANISIYIFKVSRANFYLQSFKIFDQIVYYEDMDFSSLSMENNHVVKTKQPKNVSDLKFQIQQQMNDIIPKHWIVGQYDVDRSKLRVLP